MAQRILEKAGQTGRSRQASSTTDSDGHTGASAALGDHATATSLAAEGFARKFRFPDPDLAFLVGLIHSIGQMVLPLSHSDRFGQLRDQAKLYPHEGMVIGWEQEATGLTAPK